MSFSSLSSSPSTPAPFKMLVLDHYVPHPSFSYPNNHNAHSFREERQKEMQTMERFFPQGLGITSVLVEKQTQQTWQKILVTLGDYDGVLLGGSPFSVNDSDLEWLEEEKEFLKEALQKKDISFLGICFGNQLLATVLGGTVESHHRYIHEHAELDFHKRDNITSFACHEEYVSSLPHGAKVLARGENKMPYYIKYSDNTYGVQTHPEREVDHIDSEDFWKKELHTKIFSPEI